ncbi:MAG: HlyC/CorC family transporter [Pirellulales bacterium]|nr:HlyC/CorC family transporter [Pirellulales bacterium]
MFLHVYWLEIIIILAMIGLNSVFAAYEIALASVSVAQLQVLVKDGLRGAKAALFMKENFEASLATVQLGITLLGAIAAATGGAGAEKSLEPLFSRTLGFSPGFSRFCALAAVVVPITAVTIIFGELVPKVFAIRNKERVCLRLSPTMRWFSFSVWPAVWLLESAVTGIIWLGERRKRGADDPHKHESIELQSLRASVALARASRLIGERQESIILRAAQLTGRPIREIMLPAEFINMLALTDTLEQCLVAAHLDMHTRFPVSERPDDPQTIIGYVNFKDLLALMRMAKGGELSLRAILRPFPHLNDSLPIALCLERMIREHTHIALVVDSPVGPVDKLSVGPVDNLSYSRVVGMVTLEDILEELVGDIEDEYDRLPTHCTPSGKSWVVGGGIGLARLRELTGLDLTGDLPPQGAVTLSDWFSGHLNRPPRGGDEINRRGIRAVLRKIRRNKVMEAQVGREP